MIESIHRARRPLVLSHRDSDADSLGSALALGGAFAQLGVEAVLAVHHPDRIAPPLNELPGASTVVPLGADLAAADHDVVFVVDTASPTLLGGEPSVREALLNDRPVVNIDHHDSNQHYGAVNYVETAAAATAEVLWGILTEAGIPLTPDMATNLQAGLVGDTLGFQIADTSPRTLRAAASLLQAGGATHGLPRRVLNARTIAATRLYGAALAAVQVTADGRIVWTCVTQGMAASVDASVHYSHGLPNALQEVVGAEIAAVFYELGPERTRASLRSTGRPIREVAEEYGGGGHQLAAGLTIQQPIGVAEPMVIDRLQALLDA